MGICKSYTPPSKWFKECDITDGKGALVAAVTMTIKAVGETTFDDGKIQPTLSFNETDKELGLNKTNREKLAELFGRDEGDGMLDWEPDDVIGQQITLFRAKTQDPKGATINCVRIRAVAQAMKTQPRAAKAAPPPRAVSGRPAPARASVPTQDDGSPINENDALPTEENIPF